jgi:cytosine/adenosine deaminase-related metal-dependent hydrolase
MILHDLHILGTEGLKHIHVEHGKIRSITDSRNALEHLPGELHLELDNALAFPGLINSHDHLDFNLFPALGNRVYKSYTEWGHDIHVNNGDAIKEVLQIPQHLRVQWGLYKNLLNGFTAVVNHGQKLSVNEELITVFQDCYSLHSPSFEKNWRWKLNNPFQSRKPVVMHMGEGTDKMAGKEIDSVIRWNILRKKIVAVHGVAMNEKQAASFAGLVWCPASNQFLLGKTASIHKLKEHVQIVFGTDSTLTASWNAWEHIRLARNSSMLSDHELIASLTSSPAGLWGLSDHGSIAENKVTNIVVARNDKNHFFDLDPEDIMLVLHNGEIMMAGEELFSSFSKEIDFGNKFSKIRVGNQVKFIWGDLPGLMNECRKYFPGACFPVSGI